MFALNGSHFLLAKASYTSLSALFIVGPKLLFRQQIVHQLALVPPPSLSLLSARFQFSLLNKDCSFQAPPPPVWPTDPG